MSIVSAIFRGLFGLLFGFLSVLCLTPAFAAFSSGDNISPAIMWGAILLCGVICFFAPTIRRAIGRGFLLLGASVFALPISAFLLSGRVASDMMNSTVSGNEAATAIGAGMAGVAVTGVATFFGLIVGSILLVIGLVLCLGGRREVIVVNGPYRSEPAMRKR